MKIKVKGIEFHGIFSGELSYNNTKQYKVGGCDLGFPLYDEKNDKLFLLFGDTFQENNFKYDWRSNTMCQVKEVDSQNRIIVDSFITYLDNMASPLSESHHTDQLEMTRIPTGAIAINDTYYFYYFSMCCWKYEPDNRMNLGGLVKSENHGKTWTKVNEITFLNDLDKESAKQILDEDNDQKPLHLNIDASSKLNHSFTQIFPKAEGDYIYLFAEAGYRNNPLRMGRVKKENIEKYEEYEYLVNYCNGEPVFEKGDKARLLMHEKKTPIVCPALMGEMSLIYNPYLKKYCLFTITKSKDYPKEEDEPGLYMFYSDKITGPYNDYVKICNENDSRINITGCYAPMTHEKFLLEGGKKTILLISQWIPLYNPITVSVEMEKDYEN